MKKQICSFLSISTSLMALDPLLISTHELKEIGKKIWHNECKGTIEGLTSWNYGEEFASLGIGHFIWYPAKKPTIAFQETFPSLLTYFKQQKVQLPLWLEKATHCPWRTRHEFIAAKRSKKMQALRTMLAGTIELQTQFIVERFNAALIKFEKKLPTQNYIHVQQQLEHIFKTINGKYAAIDYANFKGMGFNTEERYNNQGWGFIQVLEHMKKNTPESNALQEFAEAAKAVLAARVQNAPPTRNEARWLKGWFNRIEGYVRAES